MDNLWFAEIRNILRSPKKLIETAAIILVPILYAGMFIWSFWDPYGHLEKLPVAVVNEDKGAQMEGEHLALGDKLIKNLKEKDSFDFHFVDKQTAEKKLNDNQYYMIIEIPEDFSKNATTLLDKNPKKLQLNYIQNQAMNYTSSKIEESAMTKIKSSVAEQVTKTYAEEVFGKVKEMANGYRSAGNGASSLAKGSGKLNDGAVVLRKGTENLLTGATALNDGIGRVHNGAADLNKGALKLYNGSRTLGEGIAQANSGAVSLKNHLAQLAASSVTFSNGLSEAKSGADKVANGSKSLASGMNQLQTASGQLLDASKQLQSGADKVANGSATLSNGLNDANKKLPALTSGTAKVQSGVKELQQKLPENLAAGITSQMEKTMMSPRVQSQIDAMSGSMFDQQKAQAENLLSQLKQVLPPETYQTVSNQILSNYTDKKKQEFQQAFQDEVKNKLLASLTSGSASTQAALQSQIQQAIAPYFSDLNEGLTKVSSGQQKLQTGIDQLTKGANTLNAGAQQLASGQNAFVKNATIFNGKLQQAASGANSLESGATAVASGLGQLSSGSGQLVTGTKQLADGSSTLAEGTGKLADGSNELTNGTQSLANGSSVLVKGTSQLLNGAGQLQSGSKQLNNGAGNLVSGTGQLNDGADKLSNKLGKAADQAGAINPTGATYNMMSSPVRLNHDAVTKVPNYGTGLAPYFLSLGLFVGGLLLTIIYNVKAPAIMPKNGVTWFLGKFGVMALIGVLQSLLADFILLDLLKLHVQSVPLFMIATIVTSLTYMAIIHFLVAAFANPGRYISVIILILQLTTSAGTFPLELIPKPLQAVHDLMPMTYSLQMFKAVISSGDFSYMWQNVDKLSVFFAAFIFLSLLYFVVKFRHLHRMAEKEGAASPVEA
ncbi:YhgE/Pip domain-containing protein [Weizmannia coagulans]|jgi:putative membrane protein|uniref:Membrane protein n=2 Tax=Heyndrickxia TaxID=2837504 RepID=A0AAN0T6G5_HEYCO|nr:MULTISPECIES: YhgE/Pip domain-containing protein [Heyndrickxia]AJO23832.1 membrane protein [Heyndrickxia coagulans]AKN54679.1 Phage infection protein [Heyndrickxia coagulans]ATW83839.1 YhgE/Pip domain-containing protein [Heyndrickxia coagulans]KGB30870.1 membrane protein [Heyndrickxia coagulans]KXT20396.1 membrane protein [Heyndrickxia coagulans]